MPLDKEPVVIWFNYRSTGELLTRLFGRWSCDSPRGSGSASVCSKHATLQCFKELYAQAKPTVGRPWSKKAKAEEKKNCFYKGGVKWKAGPQVRSPEGYQGQHGGREISANSFGFLLSLILNLFWKQHLGALLVMYHCFRMTSVPGQASNTLFFG